MKIFELNNKQTIPAVGFGVFMIPNDGQIGRAHV